jgi:hypothetical protein
VYLGLGRLAVLEPGDACSLRAYAEGGLLWGSNDSSFARDDLRRCERHSREQWNEKICFFLS